MRRFPHYLLALALVAGATSSVAPRAVAQTTDQEKVRQGYEQKQQNAAEQDATASRLANLRGQRQQLDSTLASLEVRVAAANARIEAAQAEADHVTAIAAEIQAKVDETLRELDQAEADMKRSALLLYTQHGAGISGTLSLLNSTEGSGRIVEGNHYLKRVSEKRRHDATRVKRLRNELESQQLLVAQQKQAAEIARISATNEREALDTLIAEQARSREAVAANEQQTNAVLAELAARGVEIKAEFEAASARVTAALVASGNAGPGPSGFIRPVGGPVASGFGYRSDPISGATAFHSGVDFGASCGTPIKAGNTGTVFQVTPTAASGGYGNMTILTHGGGVATLYAHQSSIVVSPGAVVAIGDVIGYVGNTGKSTGCHLHWEVRVNGTAVNPAGYL